MNYKIKITAENQAIVKRIADENGMNEIGFLFTEFDLYYIIVENKFWTNDYESDDTELTTEQFIEMFDKKETEHDKWLRETKAKNLSLEELRDETNFLDTKFYNQIRRELKVVGTLYQHLFNLWNNQTEWHPKRGDKVLVWDYSYQEPKERIFLSTDGHEDFPILAVRKSK
jgi:hypothetical protein